MSRRYEAAEYDQPTRPGGRPEPVEIRRKQPGETLRSRYGGFDWVATFLGFAVTTFFLTVLLGIVGSIVGSVGYQLGAKVPRVGESISGATQQLGLGALGGSILALILAYFIGGYAAGRLARYDGLINGMGVVVWTVLIAIILAVLGALLGSKFNVASQLHLSIDAASLTTAGLISLAVTLLVMLVASALGGWLGARYHKKIDRDTAVRP
jgi:magnesium-transporting ATPase (P-type)